MQSLYVLFESLNFCDCSKKVSPGKKKNKTVNHVILTNRIWWQ